MVFHINNDCICCGLCAEECPVSCIHERDNRYIIDDSECIDCGSCAEVCPVDAPHPEED